MCGGVLCRFSVQTQLAHSGSKLQLNSGSLTELIRSLKLHHSHFQPIELIQIYAGADFPVFSRPARRCLTTIFHGCPAEGIDWKAVSSFQWS